MCWHSTTDKCPLQYFTQGNAQLKIIIRPLLIIVLLLLASGLSLRFTARGDYAKNSIPTVRVTPPEVAGPHLTPSRNFTIAIEIMDVIDLKGFDIQLSWDTSILNYTSHTVKVPVETYPGGILHTQVMEVQNRVNITLGTYWVAFATVNGPSFIGTGTVFEMTFTVLDFGACVLDIYGSDLANSTAKPIDHVVEDGYFSNLFYDVAVLSVAPSSPAATIGDTLNITVTVLNNGTTRSETFDVTVYYNDTVIAIQSVLDLPPNVEEALEFQWDTTGKPPGDYVISANATTVPGEARIGNNRLVDGVVILVAEQVHDVALTALTSFKTLVFKGFCFCVNVTVENQGNLPENVNIILYANNIAVNNTAVYIGRNSSVDLKFSWKVTNAIEYEYYPLNATAEPVQGEINTADNTLFYDDVRVSHPGDFDADEDVDIFDVVMIASVYAAEIGDPAYNPNLDVNCDGKINIFDVVMIAPSYGYKKA